MRQTKKYIILFNLIIFSLLSNRVLLAQNYQETLLFADKQSEVQNYDLALKTYKRLIFFSNNKDKYTLYKRVADIASLQNDFQTAQQYYGLAYNTAHNDSLKTSVLFEKAYAELLNKNYQFAILDLLTVNTDDEAIRQKVDFYLGTCYFGLEDYSESQRYFAQCIDSTALDELEQLFADKKLHKPSPVKARILSMIFPGMGQFYTGHYKDGVNSLMLTAGLFALGAYSAVTIDPLYGIISVLPWFQRYYQGGFTNAENLAKSKRQKNRNDIFNHIIDLIQNNRIR